MAIQEWRGNRKILIPTGSHLEKITIIHHLPTIQHQIRQNESKIMIRTEEFSLANTTAPIPGLPKITAVLEENPKTIINGAEVMGVEMIGEPEVVVLVVEMEEV
jgi:hypothetical protein